MKEMQVVIDLSVIDIPYM